MCSNSFGKLSSKPWLLMQLQAGTMIQDSLYDILYITNYYSVHRVGTVQPVCLNSPLESSLECHFVAVTVTDHSPVTCLIPEHAHSCSFTGTSLTLLRLPLSQNTHLTLMQDTLLNVMPWQQLWYSFPQFLWSPVTGAIPYCLPSLQTLQIVYVVETP